MVVGVGACRQWELRWGDPFGVAVGEFSGFPTLVEESVVGSAGQGEFVDIGQTTVGPFVDVVDLGPRMAAACPTCGAALSTADRATLRPIAAQIFRCPPGQHPRAFEARCGGCGRILIVLRRDDELVLVPGDQGALLKWIRESEREDVGSGKRGDRNRGGAR